MGPEGVACLAGEPVWRPEGAAWRDYSSEILLDDPVGLPLIGSSRPAGQVNLRGRVIRRRQFEQYVDPTRACQSFHQNFAGARAHVRGILRHVDQIDGFVRIGLQVE